MQDEWNGFEQVSDDVMLQSVDTTFDHTNLNRIIEVVSTLPSDKKFINKISKIVTGRKTMYDNNVIDWGTAETLAYGTLLSEGYNVRMSGQDTERGTFSHRHAVVKVEDSEEEVTLLNNLQNETSRFQIYNSLLSEYAVLGFDYGYALTNPNTLTIWEAQFGDFSNGCQIIIDQYISCGEDKWNNQNGIVLLLPHGYEGQGAEHSSARLERYLQLCARHNMYVADCTTPANFFHLLRRQMKTKFRKPLIVFSPKSLLRHPLCVSTQDDLANGSFQETIDDQLVNKKEVKTLVFVTGKFYYDILAEREKNERNDVALVRIEQLFPLPVAQLKEIIAKYPNADDYVWAQEEPKNMGAYSFMLMNFDLVKWRLASLKAYAATAAGSSTRDRRRHADAIRMVFDKDLFR
jgi:2-oxoglutarate dehydrogenase E1 component